jgi:hypothetical protein
MAQIIRSEVPSQMPQLVLHGLAEDEQSMLMRDEVEVAQVGFNCDNFVEEEVGSAWLRTDARAKDVNRDIGGVVEVEGATFGWVEADRTCRGREVSEDVLKLGRIRG